MIASQPLKNHPRVLTFFDPQGTGTGSIAVSPEFEEYDVRVMLSELMRELQDLMAIGIIAMAEEQMRAGRRTGQSPHRELSPIEGREGVLGTRRSRSRLREGVPFRIQDPHG